MEAETTPLDAGKGFLSYKWTPTGDTTQWIEVKDLGDYLVIVDSYLGCSGAGNEVVRRRCNLSYYIHNAFTPNGDYLNDVFSVSGDFIDSAELVIYNRWVQLRSTGKEWSGENSPSGAYLYTADVKGFVDQSPYTQSEAGTVHLIR